MFFNHDGISITFVGFNANSSGDLIDSVKNARIEGLEGVLDRKLHAGLKQKLTSAKTTSGYDHDAEELSDGSKVNPT